MEFIVHFQCDTTKKTRPSRPKIEKGPADAGPRCRWVNAPRRGDIRYHGPRHAPSGRAPSSSDHPVSTAYNVPGQRNGGQSAPPREQTQYRAPPRARITCRVPRRLHRGDHTGFTTDFLVDLIRAGLATAQTERAVVGRRSMQVTRMRITDAGRRALAELRWP